MRKRIAPPVARGGARMSLGRWLLCWVALSVLFAWGWSRREPPGGEGEGEDMGGASDAAGGGVSRIPYGGGGQ